MSCHGSDVPVDKYGVDFVIRKQIKRLVVDAVQLSERITLLKLITCTCDIKESNIHSDGRQRRVLLYCYKNSLFKLLPLH